jgi:hypothetical protein
MPHVSAEMRKCIDECTNCAEVCIETTTHSLTQGGKHADPRHIGLLQDCVDICATSAKFMLRGSELHPSTCAVCAEVCLACAESCDSIGSEDFLKRCAQVCRSCADSCREIAGIRKAA